MHPAWPDVEAIDASIARLREPRSPAAIHGVALKDQPLSALLSDRMPDINTVTPDPNLITKPASERIGDIRERLSERNRRIAMRQSEAQQADLKADIAAYAGKMSARQADEDEAIVKKQMHEIRMLQLQEAALRSQLRILGGMPWGPDVQDKLASVLKQIKDLDDQIPLLIAAVHAQHSADIADYRKSKDIELANWTVERGKALDQETDKTISGYREALNQSISSLSSLAGASQWRERRTRRTLPRIDEGAVSSSAGVTHSATTPTETVVRGLLDQRARLVSFIRSDVKRSMARVASQQNWRISYLPKPGYLDLTSSAAVIATKEWRP